MNKGLAVESTTSPTSADAGLYGDHVLQVEPYGVEQVSQEDRHGTPRGQFTLWLGSNLTIADFALGFLPISLGLPWLWSIVAILVGNLLGALIVGLSAAMGPTYGAPQLIISRYMFGRVGGYLPAALNYVSTVGWFTVNNILGTFGLRVLFPHLAFWQGAVLLVIVQSLLAIYGHNLIHLYERIMSVILGVLFLVVTVMMWRHAPTLAAYHPTGTHLWPMFAIMVAAAFSYVGSWSGYASDYSRYLHRNSSKSSIVLWASLGSFVGSVWLELVGMMVGVLAAGLHLNPIASLHQVTGSFGAIAVIAIILGGTAADALNLYSNSLSAGALDLRVKRAYLAASAGIIGLVLSLIGAGQFESNYEGFLLMLGYWITPWLGVLIADFYIRKIWQRPGKATTPVQWSGVVSFLVGILVSVPFMNGPFYEGPLSVRMGGADISFYVGFAVALVCKLILSGGRKRQAMVGNA